MAVADTGISTVTVQVAVLLEPSAVVAVIVTMPPDTAVTRPVLLTVATDVLLLLHVTLLLVALLGVTVADSCRVWPLLVNVADVWLRVMPVAGTGMFTVTVQVVVLFEPSAVVAVIVTMPPDTAVTRPVLLTVAMEVSLLVHVTLLLVALLGETVADNCRVWPLLVNVADDWLRVMPVAGTGMFTVTVQVAVLLEPSAVVAVMVALPLATAITKPVLLTVATAELLLLQVTLLLVALLGVMVADNCNVWPLLVRVAEV
jgi:hypothetical protein